MKALIGYTGFVGANLLDQMYFDKVFNSSNIAEISENEYDLVVIAAPSAVKWKANQEPEVYMSMVDNLLINLRDVRAKFVVHISTIDVFADPNNVDENTNIDTSSLHPYGQQRYKIEEYVRVHFPQHLIVRLPGLFGKNLKKNFIYDMLNNNALDLTHKDSIFQMYDLSNLWKDISIAINSNIRLVNFATEPVSASEIATRVFKVEFNNITEKKPVLYDVKTIHYEKYSGHNGYIYSKEAVVSQLIAFVDKYKVE